MINDIEVKGKDYLIKVKFNKLLNDEQMIYTFFHLIERMSKESITKENVEDRIKDILLSECGLKVNCERK